MSEIEPAGQVAKRAPMTREQADALLLKHLRMQCMSDEEWGWTLDALLEASSDRSVDPSGTTLTLAQAREMALGCVPPDAEFRAMGTPQSQLIYDAGRAYHDHACRKIREAIEAAFKEPT